MTHVITAPPITYDNYSNKFKSRLGVELLAQGLGNRKSANDGL